MQTSAKVRALTFSGDGERVMVGLEDRTVRALSVATGAEAAEFSGLSEPAAAIAASGNGRFVTAVTKKGELCIWDARRNKRLHRLDLQVGVSAMRFLPDKATLLLGCIDGAILAIDVVGGRPLGRFEAHDAAVTDLAVSKDGSHLASVDAQGQVTVWNRPSVSRRGQRAGARATKKAKVSAVGS